MTTARQRDLDLARAIADADGRVVEVTWRRNVPTYRILPKGRSLPPTGREDADECDRAFGVTR